MVADEIEGSEVFQGLRFLLSSCFFCVVACLLFSVLMLCMKGTVVVVLC
jgi:hypothetical protein